MILFEDVRGILGDLAIDPVPPDWPKGRVARVEQDSRRILSGALFVAVTGRTTDGRKFLASAKAAGAAAAVGEAPSEGPLPYLCVRDARRAAAILAARHEGDPSHEIDLVGITGTNGKTTTSWLLQSIWEGAGIPAAVSGTLGVGHPSRLGATSYTTPDAPSFQGALRALAAAGFRAVAAEISSHALDQDRTYASRFRAVVFTNLTRDHLDYHGSEEAYRAAKRRLFHPEHRGDPAPVPAVMNLDDPAARELIEGSPDALHGYGTHAGAFCRLRSIDVETAGLRLAVETPRGTRTIRSPLAGAFNGWNLLAAYATALAIGVDADSAEAALLRGARVPGRMERIDQGQPFLVVIDYAHTPDALERVLAALRPQTGGRLVVVFGCGGDRDQGKRPLMGAIAARGADLVVLTNDNPRSEDPRAILQAIAAGIRREGRSPAAMIDDRSQAIQHALAMAAPGDTILVAGKGAETTQETAQGLRELDDRVVTRAALAQLGWTA